MYASSRIFRSLSFSLLLTVTGCRCSKLAGEVGSVAFKRCAQMSPPDSRSWHAGELELVIEDRVLRVKGKQDSIRIAAFTGPVGAALTRHELAAITAARPQLVVMLGGLGDDEEMAKASLAGLAALRVPSLFIAGGADRSAVVQAAFDDVEDAARDFVIHGSGLRELTIGRDRFAIMAGAPDGRYALDDKSCGFENDDLSDLRDAIEAGDTKTSRVWLLSWAAPAGFGVTRALGGQDVGSEGLAELAEDIGARGGLFAFPESAVAQALKDAQGKGFSLVVPRLGRTGASRADGGRVVSSVARLAVGAAGLGLQ